jgi:hypothetical protein
MRIASGDKLIATLECNTADNGGWPSVSNPEEARANGLLIIAATELLEAVKVAELFMSGFEDDDMQPGINESLALLRQVIRKAQGE